ncbi:MULTISPECIES: TetR/AcrR family transcriptional regulator [unclassified Kocuria]|uniref:TetR/AcrR family transcriptional regulator n=1 Tax=unclassified Kocuria TaxID=2649579 RepID=UPI001EE7D158|nr:MULTISPECIES: TetR/AcrR family transcriptional regulator [unclassified Kocuria]
MSNQTQAEYVAGTEPGRGTPPPGEASSPDRRSRPATRLKLIRSAPAVFAEQGIDGASVSDLCAAAGFTRGAFYSNFETKHELAVLAFDDLATQLIETLDSELDQWLDSGLEVGEVVTRIIEGVTDSVANVQQQALRMELFLAAFRSPEARAAVAPVRERIYAAIENALGRVARSQHLTLMVPAAEMARILVTSYSGQLTDQMAMGATGRGAQRVIPTIWLAFTRPA